MSSVSELRTPCASGRHSASKPTVGERSRRSSSRSIAAVKSLAVAALSTSLTCAAGTAKSCAARAATTDGIRRAAARGAESERRWSASAGLDDIPHVFPCVSQEAAIAATHDARCDLTKKLV